MATIAGPLVAALGVEADLRSLGQGPSIGYGALMDEEVGRAVLGCDETEALLVVEPLHGSVRHVNPPRAVRADAEDA